MSRYYPPQTGLYKVVPKSEQSTHRWSDFDMARLQISVGQPYHEGAKFAATLEWSLGRFERVVLCVNDTLQRYNAMFERGLSETRAAEEAETAGTEWIARNLGHVQDDARLVVQRWSRWLTHPRYPDILERIHHLDDTQPAFSDAITADIERLWARRHATDPERYPMHLRAAFADLARAYLCEEIAAFALMYEQHEAIDIYPGTSLFAARVAQDQDFPDAPPGLGKGRFCRIDFARNGNKLKLQLG